VTSDFVFSYKNISGENNMFESLSENKQKESLDRSNVLEEVYDPRFYGQVFPFRTEQTLDRVTNLLDEKEKFAPLAVLTGKMGMVAAGREILTDGVAGCVVVFSRGEKGTLMAHAVSGNDFRKFGYWANKYGDPVPNTADDIAASVKLLGEGAGVTIVANTNPTAVEHWERMKAELLNRGIKSVDIVENDVDNSLIYYSPKASGTLLVIGYDKKKQEKRKIEINLK
jgi:hypothetical protein